MITTTTATAPVKVLSRNQNYRSVQNYNELNWFQFESAGFSPGAEAQWRNFILANSGNLFIAIVIVPVRRLTADRLPSFRASIAPSSDLGIVSDKQL